MIGYVYYRLILVFTFLLLFGPFFFSAALVFHSFALAGLGFFVSGVGMLAVLLRAHAQMIRQLGAVPFSQGKMAESLFRIQQKLALTSRQVEFWYFSNPEVRIEIWFPVFLGRKTTIFLSQGALNTLSEEQLANDVKQLFEQIYHTKTLRELKLKQDQRVLFDFFKELKGDELHFRYWFVSFWLLPFENAFKKRKRDDAIPQT